MPKTILFIAGSTRTDSYNVSLAKAAQKEAESQGAQTEFINLSDYNMPLFNEDWEADNGVPKDAITLKEKMAASDGVFFATPEYNSSIPPLLKNTVDWVTRQHEDNEKPLKAFDDKAAAIAATSPGALGGIRVLVPLRLMLANIGMNVVGTQLAVAKANEAINDDDTLAQDMHQKMLKKMIKTLIRIA